MSRHRFVRNLDLDDELNDEEESGMSTEEQAQMATALPIARALLKDIKPPISDDTIADSLWHYWFDVEKTVGWLRQDWERKGEALPEFLMPTPDQQPRKRRRLAASDTDPSLQPPLTALQRLSLSRKQPSPSPGPSGPSSSSAASQTPDKPMSKLALLAQKRREAAQAAESSASPSRTPTRAATPASAVQHTISESPSGKPLSKLAQKMAAARAAREEAAAKSDTPTKPSPPSAMEVDPSQSSAPPDEEPTSILFATASPSGRTKPPSPFFSIITSTATTANDQQPPEIGTVASLHVPLATDLTTLTKRFEEAFTESPDEIVLRKRQGRAGTADLTPVVKKQTKGTGTKAK
nr:uncharacterized protein CI109_003503 [Kwoniella shandongensis]KAA5528214.1 hypothetical protein CI109_003503 [Kwoniella shandongensis]